jgi:hypothetical protein
MKVKFTKASKKDFNLVTVSLPALATAGVDIIPTDLYRGDQFELTIYQGDNGNRRKVLFTVNRDGRTATTTEWTLNNRPRVGKGVFYSVSKTASFV